MRSTILFLLALFLGALTVTGQDDERADLLRKIQDLEKLLATHAKQQDAPPDRLIIRRFYAVGELTTRIQDDAFEPTNLQVSKFTPPEPPELPEATIPFAIDTLMDLIRSTIETDTWDDIEGADIQPKNNSLIVFQIPRVHKGIRRLLDRLRAHVRRHVVVDVIALPVNKETAVLLGHRPRELSPAEATAINGLTPLGVARVTCFDGQQSVYGSGSTVSYLHDYEVEIAAKSAIGQPIRAELFSGCNVAVRACIDAGAKGVTLHCRLERTNVLKPMRKMETEHGPVDLPVMELTRVNTSLWAPLNRMVVIGGTTAGSKPCVFVATVKLVE